MLRGWNRATSFTEANLNLFLDYLAALKEKHKFKPQDVYNLDETGCVTVHRPLKIVAENGKRDIMKSLFPKVDTRKMKLCKKNAVHNEFSDSDESVHISLHDSDSDTESGVDGFSQELEVEAMSNFLEKQKVLFDSVYQICEIHSEAYDGRLSQDSDG